MSEIERERRIVDLLNRAVELEGSARRQFLDGACLGDPTLRAELASMLEEDPVGSDTFLAMPAVANLADGPTRDLEDDTPPQSPVPQRIGPYRIVGTLGQGGMGTVYLGEQTEPVRRRAALKMLDTIHDPRRLQRFAAECQALARLNHPNVAALYDVGTTDERHPYVAMEPVDGTAITVWCDLRQLPLEERIKLFFGVCAGVRHAHEKGILHRDLKPANVLVTEVDGVPTAKVIDFGIARAFGEPLHSGSKPMTLENQIVGSPAYMCPEIAAGEREVDTRSDVYSLGLLLYELLVGALPFETRDVDLVTLLRRVAKEERPAPSARYAELDLESRHRIAADRSQGSPRRLSHRVRGDLDAIVVKTLALDAQDRYSSPADLATDLKRHLEIRPVAVRAASNSYRTGRFIRRHRTMVAAGVLVTIALVMGIVGTAREARRANLETQRATRALAESQAVSEFLTGLFEVSDPRHAQGEGITARELLDRGAEQLSYRFADQPLSKSRVMGTIGGIYTQLGLYERAETLLKAGLAIHEAELGADHPQTAATVHELADLYRFMGRYQAAEPLFRRALAIREKALGPEHPYVTSSLTNLGSLYRDQGRLEEAEPLLRRALAVKQQTLAPDHPHIANSLISVADLLHDQGRFDEAERLARSALPIREKVLGSDHPETLQAVASLAKFLRKQQRYAEAELLYERALGTLDPSSPPNDPDIAAVAKDYSLLLQALDRNAEAAALEAWLSP